MLFFTQIYKYRFNKSLRLLINNFSSSPIYSNAYIYFLLFLVIYLYSGLLHATCPFRLKLTNTETFHA